MLIVDVQRTPNSLDVVGAPADGTNRRARNIFNVEGHLASTPFLDLLATVFKEPPWVPDLSLYRCR